MPSTELELKHTAYSWEQTNWIAGHQTPIVGDNGNWHIPDIETMTYQDTGRPVTGYSPYIGINGNWWVWDTNAKTYIDSGVTAATGLSDGAVTTDKLASQAVTMAKLSQEVQDAIANAGDGGDPVTVTIPLLPSSDYGEIGSVESDDITEKHEIPNAHLLRYDDPNLEGTLMYKTEDGKITVYGICTAATSTTVTLLVPKTATPK